MSIGYVVRRFGLVAIFWLGNLCVAGPGSAVEQMWGYKATLTTYVDDPIPGVPIGSTIRGQVVFDNPGFGDQEADPTLGVYQSEYFVFAIESPATGLNFGAGAFGEIYIHDDFDTGIGTFSDGITVVHLGVDVPALGLIGYYVDMVLDERDITPPAVLTSDALPAPPPALSGFTSGKTLIYNGQLGPDRMIFEAEITQFGTVGVISLPLIPFTSTTNPDGTVTWNFSTLGVSICGIGCWVDPPVSSAFTYTMTNSALFTDIVDFPTGFGTALEVTVGATSYGPFGPGDSLTFPGGGVAEFEISGISPAADLTSAEGFPLKLAFDSAGAEFSMTSHLDLVVPALSWPGSLALGCLVSLAGAYTLRRSGRRSAR